MRTLTFVCWATGCGAGGYQTHQHHAAEEAPEGEPGAGDIDHEAHAPPQHCHAV